MSKQNIIEINHLTKDYGNGKGVFDVTFSLQKGEVLGFLGPNGAGKTTTIRQLLGFMKPDKGTCNIYGKDCFRNAEAIQKNLGYLPGEIAFMEDMNGTEFIHFIAKMKGLEKQERMNELIQYFELDLKGKIRKMSKGMKQKIGLICAFMQEAEVVILDEPTSGLDPLMQNKFVELILEEKNKGRTILMSSHIFEEVERTCDRVAIIKDGHLMAVEDMDTLKKNRRKLYDITFMQEADAKKFATSQKDRKQQGKKVTASDLGNIDVFIKELSKYSVAELKVREQSLEELFMHYYGKEEK